MSKEDKYLQSLNIKCILVPLLVLKLNKLIELIEVNKQQPQNILPILVKLLKLDKKIEVRQYTSHICYIISIKIR